MGVLRRRLMLSAWRDREAEAIRIGSRTRTHYLIAGLFSLLTLDSISTASDRLRFWNLTGFTINELHRAPAGTTEWGPTSAKTIPMVPSTPMSG